MRKTMVESFVAVTSVGASMLVVLLAGLSIIAALQGWPLQRQVALLISLGCSFYVALYLADTNNWYFSQEKEEPHKLEGRLHETN